VQLCRDNLLGDRFLLGHKPYDFIFCRNLLIYFDRDTQVRALEKLHLLLAPQGVLFVGAAELPLVTDNGFVNARLTKAFACRKAAPVLGSTSGHAAMPLPETGEDGRVGQCSPGTQSPLRDDLLPGVKQENAAAPPLTWSPATPGKWPKAQRQPCRENAIPIAREMPSDLDTARQLADAGNLENAATVCQAHLHERGPSAPAYYLLGLVREAVGDPQAIEYYRKALYLEPNHYETLLQMSLLLERTGDLSGARILKRRAQRVQQTL
jgi:chemotaxis protein methyltransferase WspC